MFTLTNPCIKDIIVDKLIKLTLFLTNIYPFITFTLSIAEVLNLQVSIRVHITFAIISLQYLPPRLLILQLLNDGFVRNVIMRSSNLLNHLAILLVLLFLVSQDVFLGGHLEVRNCVEKLNHSFCRDEN